MPTILTTPPWNARQVREALRMRYPSGDGNTLGVGSFALIEEVASSTGFAKRYADAIGMELWKSNGYEWHGFEIKVSRTDWLGELKQPDKAEEFKQYMDRWWLVLGDASIIKPGELPAGWGLLAPQGGVLHAVTKAPKLTPQPMPRSFLAAIMRRVVEQSVDMQRVVEAEQRGRVDGWNLARHASDSIESHAQYLRRMRDELKIMQARITSCLRGASGDDR